MSGSKNSWWARMWVPIVSGLAVLMSGYVALLFFWAIDTRSVGIPGLFHYHDATWGDGLLLPCLAVCLQALIRQLDKPSRNWPTWTACGAGGFAGALLIFTWWTDPHPSPNWTLPRPHDFTLPGQWHAAFLIAASAFFAGSWIELFRRIHAADVDKAAQVLASPLIACAIACTAGYAWLAASDSAHAARTASGRGSLIALAVSTVALIACLTWAARGSLAAVARSVVAGLLLAATLVVFTYTYGRTGSFMLFVALIGALGAGVALAGTPGRGDRILSLEIVAVPALYAVLVLLAAHSTKLIVVLAAPTAAIILSAGLRCLYTPGDQARRSWLSVNYLAGAGISACLLGAGTFGLWLSAQRANAYVTAGFLLTIIGAVLGGVFLPYYRTDYIKLMEIEGEPVIRQADGRPSPSQHQAAVHAWFRIGGYAISATASMLVLTVALAPSLGWRTGTAHIAWLYPLGIMAIGLILIAPTAGAIVQSCKRHPFQGPLYKPRGGDIYALWSLLGGVAVAALGAVLLIRDAELNPLALTQTVFLTAFTVLTMADTGALLHTRQVNSRSRLAIICNSLAIFAVIYWSLTAAVRPAGSVSSVGASFAAFISAVLFVSLLVGTTTCAIYVSGGQPYRTDYPPIAGISQDCFLMTCMWFLLAWTPQVVLTHIPNGTHERWSAVGTILAGFLLLFGPAYLWILENNDTHVERQRRIRKVQARGVLAPLASATSSADRIRTLPGRINGLMQSMRGSRRNHDPELTQREFMIRLSGHTATQNIISIILAVATVIGIIGVSSGLAPTAVGVTGLASEETR